MIILGIESSCDETGLALYDSNHGMLGHVVNSQHTIHGKYGGVVPELASRDHVLKLVPLLDELLNLAKLKLNDINLVAFTNGPGLLGPLLTGASFAKSLSWTLKIPSIEVDHLEAHIFSPMISEKNLKPPFISLLVSGGHTILSSITNKSNYKILGKTLDDSAGEVFDKVARHLGLPYSWWSPEII
jgi:metallohydrolase, glycoprotease/Kae1 family